MEDKRKVRNDRLLMVGITFIAMVLLAFFLLKGSNMGTTVVVTLDGKQFGRYSLIKEQVVQIGDTNTLIICNHEADMLFAECPDQICVKHTPISATDENIICLPNKIVVTVEDIWGNNTESELDAVVK